MADTRNGFGSARRAFLQQSACDETERQMFNTVK